MKVYLLVNNFAYDGTPDSSIAVFATRRLAEQKMREEFEEYKQEYLDNFSEENVEIDEPDSLGASIYLKGDYNEKHDDWLIVESEVQGRECFEVCTVEREDLENRDFDTSKLTDEDMERIASKAGDLMLEGCDYWTGIVEAARYWEVPTKEEE